MIVWNSYTDCDTHSLLDMLSKCSEKSCRNWRVSRKQYCEVRKLSSSQRSRWILTQLDLCIEPNDCSKKVVSESRPFCPDRKPMYPSSPKPLSNLCKSDNLCTVPGCRKERCQYGDHFEYVCCDRKFQVHAWTNLIIIDTPLDYVPLCAVNACTERSSIPSKYCELRALFSITLPRLKLTLPDACQQRNCLNEARPSRGRLFCSDRKSSSPAVYFTLWPLADRCRSDIECQLPRTFSEGDNTLKRNEYCMLRKCCSKQEFKLPSLMTTSKTSAKQKDVPNTIFARSHTATLVWNLTPCWFLY